MSLPQYQFIKFLGYSDKEIEKFVKTMLAKGANRESIIIPKDMMVHVKTYKDVNLITLQKLEPKEKEKEREVTKNTT